MFGVIIGAMAFGCAIDDYFGLNLICAGIGVALGVLLAGNIKARRASVN